MTFVFKTLQVSITRLQNFFNLPEIAPLLTSPGKKGTIKVENGSFKWTKEAETSTLEDINIEVKNGELVAVVGHIGSGKRSAFEKVKPENQIFCFLYQMSSAVYERFSL